MQEKPKICPLCKRATRGEPRCRDHGESRVFVKLDSFKGAPADAE